MKNTILKVLSLVLILTFALTAVFGMTGCNEEIKEDIAKNEAGLEEANAAIKTANAAIAKLKDDLEALNGISATRNDILSASLTALQANITENEAALAELETALRDQATASANALDAKATELQAEIDAAEARLDTLEGEEKAALQAQIDANKTAIAALQTAAAALRTDVDAAATKDALDAAVEALNGVDEELQAAIDAAEARLDALENDESLQAQINANKAAIEANQTTITTITTDLATVQQTIADQKTTLEAKIQKNIDDIAALVAEVATLTSDLAEAKTTLKNSIETVAASVSAIQTNYATKTELATEISTLTNGVIKDLQDAIDALNDTYTTDEELTAAIDTLTGLITEQGITLDDLTGDNNFESRYNNATDILNGEVLIDDEEYSIEAFEELVDEYSETEYSENVWKAYLKKVGILEFRLNRAVSAEQIVEIFNALKEYQASESFKAIIEEFAELVEEVETNKISVADAADGILDIDEFFVEYAVETKDGYTDGDPSLKDRYEAICAARDRLAAAEAIAKNIATEATTILPAVLVEDTEADDGYSAAEVLYTADHNVNINYIANRYATEIVDVYFLDDNMTALYEEDALANLTGYTTSGAQVKAYADLETAKLALDNVTLNKLPTTTPWPLYTEKADIDADFALVDAWATEYEIEVDSDNYQLIFDASFGPKYSIDYADSKAAQTYADAMDEIYTTLVLDVSIEEGKNLAEQAAAEVETGADNVLFTRLGILDATWDSVDAVNDAIVAVDGYDALEDGNFDAMFNLDADKKDVITAIGLKMATLKAAKEEVDTLTATLTAKIGLVAYSDGAKITTGYKDDLNNIFVAHTIMYTLEEDTDINYVNYVAMTTDFYTALATLKEEYDGLTDKVQKIYEEVAAIVKNAGTGTLSDLQKILWASAKVDALTGVDTPDFKLKEVVIEDGEVKKDEETGAVVYMEVGGEQVYIDFTDFSSLLTAKLLYLVDLAEAAEADATAINADLEALGVYDLNKTDDFKSVFYSIAEWLETYLGMDREVFFGDNAPVEPVEPVVDDYDDVAEFNAAHDDWEFNLMPAYAAEYGDYLYNSMEDYMVNMYAEASKSFIAADEKGNNQGILGITDYNHKPATYTFLNDFAGIIGQLNTMIETLDEAETEWNAILADIAELPALGDVKIHDIEIAAASERYEIYVETYYDGAITNAQFDELTTYADLNNLQIELDTKIEAAQALYEDILREAQDLKEASYGVIAEGEVATIDAKFADLIAHIADYRTNYCDGTHELCDKQCALVGVADFYNFDDPLAPNYVISLDEKKAELEADYGVADLDHEPMADEYYLPADYTAAHTAWEDATNAYAAYEAEYESYLGYQTSLNDAGDIDAELIAYQAQAKALAVKLFADDKNKDVVEYMGVSYDLILKPQGKETLKTQISSKIDAKTDMVDDKTEEPATTAQKIKAVKDDLSLFIGLMLDPDKGATVADYTFD